MSKIGQIAIVIGVVIVCYLILLVVMPVVADLISTANTTVTAATWANHPGSQGFFIAQPWILFFVPGAIGIAAIIFILRQP